MNASPTRRRCARALLQNNEGEIYLFCYHFAMMKEEPMVWVSPGGGVEEGESLESALQRELWEELGIDIHPSALSFSHRSDRSFIYNDGSHVISEDHYFWLTLPSAQCVFSEENWTDIEVQHTVAGRWWSENEIATSSENFFMDRTALAELLRRGPRLRQ